jgi:hypothetical protein
MLQKLRDDFMAYEGKELPKENFPEIKLLPGKIISLEELAMLENPTPMRNGDTAGKQIDEDEDEAVLKLKAVENNFFGRKKSTKIKEIKDLRKNRDVFFDLPDNEDLCENVIAYDQETGRKNRLALHVRKLVSVPCAVMLESLSSSTLVLRALEKIFRAYVRGNALPGQQSGGNTVDLAGNTLSFKTFILQGPYLSWKGFLNFLLDFLIAGLPERSTKSGRRFYKTLNIHATKEIETAGSEALLTMEEAAIVFIGCCGSKSPVLMTSKYLKFYDEMAESLADYDPWKNVSDWTTLNTGNEWDIIFGINFIQFVDCVAVSNAASDLFRGCYYFFRN